MKRGLLLLCLPLLSSACKDDATDDEPRMVTVCDEEINEAEFADFMNGNLVIVGGLNEDGSSKSDAIGSLVLNMVAVGIDFTAYDSDTRFEDGAYTLTTGESQLGFSLYFAEDFGEFSAGDVVPHNVLSLDSYAQNVKVAVDTTAFPPVVLVDYDPGPLHDLIEGELEVDESSLTVSLKVRGDLLDIEVDSTGVFNDVWQPTDSLTLSMTTTRLNLAALAGDLETAGFGFSYDGTSYDAPSLGLMQSFNDSLFTTVRRDDGNYDWEGEYQARVQKGPVTMYQSGFATTAGGNYTEYYCDEGLSTAVGVAEHDDDLLGGVFTFESGSELPYGIR